MLYEVEWRFLVNIDLKVYLLAFVECVASRPICIFFHKKCIFLSNNKYHFNI